MPPRILAYGFGLTFAVTFCAVFIHWASAAAFCAFFCGIFFMSGINKISATMDDKAKAKIKPQ